MLNTSPAWRTCSISMRKSPIRSARWSASTRARSNSSVKCVRQSRPGRARSSATTANTSATEPPTCSCSSTSDRPWRKVKVTESRAAIDFAACMRELADVHFPKAERIRVVLDNLSTHSAGALYQAFPADQARRVLRRLEFHYVPKHASWLNMVEIEIGVLAAQCLDRRIESSSLPRSRHGNNSAMPQVPASNHQMDVHNRKGARQNGPCLSEPSAGLNN